MNHKVRIILRQTGRGLVLKTRPKHLNMQMQDGVEWHCETRDFLGVLGEVVFRMRFPEATPFTDGTEEQREFSVGSGDEEEPTVTTPPASVEGDFKYDVEARRPDGSLLAEEDPYLHVSR